MNNLILSAHGNTSKLESPWVMGIINITEDSFYSGSRVKSLDDFKRKVDQQIIDGAQIIDLGGQSTRPGSMRISDEEEIERVLPALDWIKKEYPNVWVSIDTYHSEVAKTCISNGAHIINDISFGIDDEKMIDVIVDQDITYIGMHKQGNPETMQENPRYQNVVDEVFNFLLDRKKEFLQKGVRNIWLDPGFGFGKTLNQNYQLLNQLQILKKVDSNILIGISRKSMIYKYLEINAEGSLNGTSALNMVALMNGAQILRVHDVKEARECVKLFEQLKKS